MLDMKLFFKDVLKKDGFKKRGNTFYKKTDNEVYFVIHIQKSQWSDSYFLNIGIKYNDIEDAFDLWNEKKVEWDSTDFMIRLGETITDDISELRSILLGGIPNNKDENFYTHIYDYIKEFFNDHKTKELFKLRHKIYLNLPNIGITKELGEYCEN